jgi:hypothetical protein
LTLWPPIYTRRYLFQLSGEVATEVLPVSPAYRGPGRLTKEFVVRAPKGTPATAPTWRLEIRDPSEFITWEAIRGTKKECVEFAWGKILEDLDEYIGRCVVCDHPAKPRCKREEMPDGWAHKGKCAREGRLGSRWLKGLEAKATQARPIP